MQIVGASSPFMLEEPLSTVRIMLWLKEWHHASTDGIDLPSLELIQLGRYTFAFAFSKDTSDLILRSDHFEWVLMVRFAQVDPTLCRHYNTKR